MPSAPSSVDAASAPAIASNAGPDAPEESMTALASCTAIGALAAIEAASSLARSIRRSTRNHLVDQSPG